ncbi:MAG: hypothetical protein JXB49_01685 [Bacteroidales bacterium]|nr:hypothetical protein [Bacteroidales bacterium]
MLKQWFIISISCILISSKAQDAIEIHVKRIREDFNNIQQNLKNDEVRKYQYLVPTSYSDKSQDFTAYLDKDRIVLLVSEYKEGKYLERNSMYYKNDELFFIFRESTEKDGSQKQERLYYLDSRLIKALIKVKDTTETRPFAQISNVKHPDVKTPYEFRDDPYQRTAIDLNNKYGTYPVFPSGVSDSMKIVTIKKEFQKINANKDKYQVKTANYYREDRTDDRYILYITNIDFTGYFNEKGHLVLLTFTIWDDMYGSDYEYYFKDGKEFFLCKTNDFEPENKKSHEQFYVYNGIPILAMVKNKTYDDPTPFSEIKFVKDGNNGFHHCGLGKSYKAEFFEALYSGEY